MKILTNSLPETSVITKIASNDMQCFVETPGKAGLDKPLARIDAFDLFNLFTADIIRSKRVFTR